MEVLRTPAFERALQKLPAGERALYQIHERLFHKNWRDPRLHVKKVQGLDGVFSFRVTRRYRALFYFRGPVSVVLFEIDHRKDVYR